MKMKIVLSCAVNALQPFLIGDLDCLRVSCGVHDYSKEIEKEQTFNEHSKHVKSYLNLQCSWLGLSSSVCSPWILSIKTRTCYVVINSFP